MFRLISIIGPTAVGKTDLALSVAAQLLEQKMASGVDIISVDSRQVYQGLELVTGADIPAGYERRSVPNFQYEFFEKNVLRLHGLAIIKPNEEWSVSHFRDLAWQVIDQALSSQRQVILVGGTGLYHDHLFNFKPQLHIPPNLELRAELEQRSLEELQERLSNMNLGRWEAMNNSDRHNPRRLIRALEIMAAQPGSKTKQATSNNLKHFHTVTVGIQAPLEYLQKTISERVAQRFESGAQEEIAHFQALYPDQNLPAWSTTGAREVTAFLAHSIDKTQCLEQWSLHEFQYAKRQLTWWKPKKDVFWVDRTLVGWQTQAFDYILSS